MAIHPHGSDGWKLFARYVTQQTAFLKTRIPTALDLPCYRISACTIITMPIPTSEEITFMAVQDFSVCGTVMPKY